MGHRLERPVAENYGTSFSRCLCKNQCYPAVLFEVRSELSVGFSLLEGKIAARIEMCLSESYSPFGRGTSGPGGVWTAGLVLMTAAISSS